MIKILLAEDDGALRGLVRTTLTDDGYEVTACHDGNEALTAMQDQKFDMLITDIMMPGTDGFELAERVRESDKNIPILFMTALDDKISMQKGFNIGIDDYLVKPFDIEILLMRIKALLRRANIERSREIAAGNFRMNRDEHTAYIAGAELPLTVREFDMRTVDVLMVKLREKTANCDGFEIVTVRGLGYKAVLK